jgi:hypothetical protein
MGEAKRRQISDKDFLKKHPDCAYCGAPSASLDHCPPRALFKQRHWPEGYRFPCCIDCNNSARFDELAVACIARFTALTDIQPLPSNESVKLLTGLSNNRPDVVSEWFPRQTRNEVKRELRALCGEFGGDIARRNGFDVMTIGPKTRNCLENFGSKLLRALYYHHVGRRADGEVFSAFCSTIRNREMVEAVLAIAPILQNTERCNKSLSDQFVYRFNVSQEHGVFVAVVQIGAQVGYFGAVFSSEFCAFMDTEHPNFRAEMSGIWSKISHGGNHSVI